MHRLRELPDTWCYKNVAVSVSGIPDIIGCHRGRFFAWELKIGSNKPTKLQAHILDEIENAGGLALVVYPETLEEAFNDLRGLYTPLPCG